MDHHGLDVHVGRRLTERTLVVEAPVQADVLRLCGIDPSLYGEQIDPAAFVRRFRSATSNFTTSALIHRCSGGRSSANGSGASSVMRSLPC
jgi:hypothetical protein